MPVAYVANGMDFPDALSAAAAARGAPLLLTATSSIPPATARELIRLKPGKIVVVGGTGVVSTTTAARLGVVGTDLPAATASRLTASSEVRAGTCLASPDRTVSLCVSAAGSFSVARGSTVLWSSGTTDAAARALRLRSDGNALLYSVDGRVIWESSTAGTGANGLSVQNDGDLVLGTAAGQIVWSSMSSAAAPKWRRRTRRARAGRQAVRTPTQEARRVPADRWTSDPEQAATGACARSPTAPSTACSARPAPTSGSTTPGDGSRRTTTS
nr:hypothetical protein GCM10025699_27200 [Microbacterium flavescens]